MQEKKLLVKSMRVSVFILTGRKSRSASKVKVAKSAVVNQRKKKKGNELKTKELALSQNERTPASQSDDLDICTTMQL